MNKILVLLIIVIIGIIIFSINQIYQDNLKINFLENDIKYLQSELSSENERYSQLITEYELPISPNNETTCGKGGIELDDGRCYLKLSTHNFTVNLRIDMNYDNRLTISGTVPVSYSSIAGWIYYNEKGVPSIITVFQLESDENGYYTHNVKINDNYLWKNNTKYTVLIQNNGEYKETIFYRD